MKHFARSISHGDTCKPPRYQRLLLINLSPSLPRGSRRGPSPADDDDRHSADTSAAASPRGTQVILWPCSPCQPRRASLVREREGSGSERNLANIQLSELMTQKKRKKDGVLNFNICPNLLQEPFSKETNFQKETGFIFLLNYPQCEVLSKFDTDKR